ncbi:MAG: NADH-quinone oxidoreductase subunit NuoK [Candidatus Thermoplasmatota archaeon]
MIPLIYYLILSAILLLVGIYGVLAKRNAVVVLMSIEIMLNAVNINFVSFSAYLTPFNPSGQVFALFSIAVAAAEVAIGLAIFLVLYRNYGTSDVMEVNILKW